MCHCKNIERLKYCAVECGCGNNLRTGQVIATVLDADEDDEIDEDDKRE
jgi:hypothetical protein